MGRRFFGLAVMVMLVLAGGCSNRLKSYPVEGKLKFADGSPVMFGQIEFRSDTEPVLNARGEIQRDGTFTVGTYSNGDGAVAGKHKVVIVQFVVSPMNMQVQHDHGLLVDRRYASYDTTDLMVEISSSGENRVELVVDADQNQDSQ